MKISDKFLFFYWIFGLIIAALFLLFGLFIIFSDAFTYVPENFRIVIGIFLIAYGLFRVINIFIKNRKNEENE